MKKRLFSNQVQQHLTALAFLAPNLILFLVFMLIPIGMGVVMGFFKWDGYNPAEFIGLKNFLRLFSDSGFRGSLGTTFYYTVLTVPATMVLALFFAMLLTREIRGRGVFRALVFFPYIASIVAVSIVWQFLYNADLGPINEALRAIGIAEPPRWTSSKDTALIAVAFMNIWRTVGYYMVVFVAGILTIPPSLYEAAHIDGASVWQRFRRVTLPMLSPTTFFVLVIAIINSFQAFTPIYVMTGGGPGNATQVLVFRIYEEAFVNSLFGYASAQAVVLFLIVLAFTIFQFKWQEKNVTYMA